MNGIQSLQSFNFVWYILKFLSKFIFFINIVFDIPTSINETNSIKDFIPDGKLLYSIINYNHVCELHYNSDMTDEQIANYLSDNVNYSINIDITFCNQII